MLNYLKKALSRKLPEDHFNNKVCYGTLRKNLRYLFPSLRRTWRIGIIAAVCLVIASILSWPIPMILRYLIDDVLLKKKINLLLPVILCIVILNILQFAFQMLQNFLNTKFTEETILDLRQRLLEVTLSLPKAFFDKNHSGYIISRISSDAEGVKFFISGTVVRIFIETMRFIGGVFFLAYLEWRIAIPVIATLPLAFITTRFFSRKNYVLSHASCEINANLNAAYVETVNNAQLIKSFAHEKTASGKIISGVKERIQLLYENAVLSTLSSGINKLMPLVAKLAVLIAGSYWVITGYWQVGTLIAFLVYLGYVYDPVNHLSASVNQLQSARATLDRIASLFKLAPEENLESGTQVAALSGDVEFRNVSFYYERENIILEDISFHVKPGEFWAVIGKSGIGKTTLVSLIMRFYIPQEGKICFDHKDASELNLKSLRNRIGYVSQNIQLISGSILDNLRYGNPDAGIETVISAAKSAGIHDFIESLPEKYNSILEENGRNLSEGQKQRVSLARTLVMDSDIIIMDEPTSALDNPTENFICDTLKKCFSGKTVFLIAHRPETIKLADNIIVLRENKIPLTGKLKKLETEIEVREILNI